MVRFIEGGVQILRSLLNAIEEFTYKMLEKKRRTATGHIIRKYHCCLVVSRWSQDAFAAPNYERVRVLLPMIVSSRRRGAHSSADDRKLSVGKEATQRTSEVQVERTRRRCYTSVERRSKGASHSIPRTASNSDILQIASHGKDGALSLSRRTRSRC